MHRLLTFRVEWLGKENLQCTVKWLFVTICIIKSLSLYKPFVPEKREPNIKKFLENYDKS